MRAAQRGDEAAFIRESQGAIWRMCAYLVDKQSADDYLGWTERKTSADGGEAVTICEPPDGLRFLPGGYASAAGESVRGTMAYPWPMCMALNGCDVSRSKIRSGPELRVLLRSGC